MTEPTLELGATIVDMGATAMSIRSLKISFPQTERLYKAPLTLARVVAAILMVNLRESLNKQSTADKTDVVLHYGLL
jgi:hypothetical protein